MESAQCARRTSPTTTPSSRSCAAPISCPRRRSRRSATSSRPGSRCWRAASAWLGSTLKIKPILTLESEMTPVERVRTSKRAFERMVDYARQREESGMKAWVVQHIQAPDQAAALAERCQEIFGHEAIFTSEVGPVLGAHTGPGLLGVGSIHEDMLR